MCKLIYIMSDQKEQISRFKKANAAGFINHMIVAGGANEKQAAELFRKSDEKASQLIQKRAAIREAILTEVKQSGSEGLAPNLGKALSS